eukprot:615510-Rhodomonas_salina.1
MWGAKGPHVSQRQEPGARKGGRKGKNKRQDKEGGRTADPADHARARGFLVGASRRDGLQVDVERDDPQVVREQVELLRRGIHVQHLVAVRDEQDHARAR